MHSNCKDQTRTKTLNLCAISTVRRSNTVLHDGVMWPIFFTDRMVSMCSIKSEGIRASTSGERSLRGSVVEEGLPVP